MAGGEKSFESQYIGYKLANDVKAKRGVVLTNTIHVVDLPSSLADNDKFAGVMIMNGKKDDQLPVAVDGFVRMVANEAIAIGDEVLLDVSAGHEGEVIPLSSASVPAGTYTVIGIAESPATAAGQDIIIRLRPMRVTKS